MCSLLWTLFAAATVIHSPAIGEEGARIDAAIADAKRAFPEWKEFIFQARSITSKHFRLGLPFQDILVQSGATETSAEIRQAVTAEFVPSYKESGALTL